MDSLSRIDKLFLDRDQTDARAARANREGFRVAIYCGDDVMSSYTLQLAALTAASLAQRCFPGAVRVVLSERLRMAAPLLLWPRLNLTLRAAFEEFLGAEAIIAAPLPGSAVILLGDAPPMPNALRVTFDGWVAKVGPASQCGRLREREYCSLAGVLSAALAVSELFLSFADISVEAGRRVLALSLWRPDTDPSDPSALGVPAEHLLGSLWVLGLGHLGNAYLWALATLPYVDPGQVVLYLNDYDTVEIENVETGIIFRPSDVAQLKTRVCCAWLETRGFRTRMIERPFDAHLRRRADDPSSEPGLALCGFDSNPTRRDLASAGFLRVLESGLGNSSSNFDTLSMHALPNPRRPDQLWPDLPAEEVSRRDLEQERLARENPAYVSLADDVCGRYGLAGKSIAVPFVGAAAASFVVAEALRLLHSGPAYTDLKFSLSTPGSCSVITREPYTAGDLIGLDYASAVKVGGP